MPAYVIGRVLQSLVLILVMTLIVFLGIQVIGNPADVLIPPDCSASCATDMAHALGLDRPIWQQYLIFLGNALHGDFGRSFELREPALQLILSRLPATLELAIAALILSVTIGLPLGLLAGLRPSAWSSRLIMGLSVLGFSLPSFWVGIILIMVFGVQFGLLPTVGRGATVHVLGIDVSFLTLDGLKHLILPAANLALYKMSLVIRLTRAGVREVILQDYVKFARAKGLRKARIVGVHVLKNILIPVITVVGMEFGSLIAFAMVTEVIFAWPGIGQTIIGAIRVLDRPLIVSYLMCIVVIFVVINLVVDLLYSALDPRVRLSRRRP